MSARVRNLYALGATIALTVVAVLSASTSAQALVSDAPWQGHLSVSNTSALNGVPEGGVTGSFSISPLQQAPANDVYPATLTYKIDYTYTVGCLTFVASGGGTVAGGLIFDWGTLDREGPPATITFRPTDSTSIQEYTELIDCEGTHFPPGPSGGPTFTEVKIPPVGSTGQAITGPLDDADGIVNYIAVADLRREANLTLQAPTNATVQYSDPIAAYNVSASNDQQAPITLTASGLPANLVFADNHDSTGTVSGTAVAAPAAYKVAYSADDGIHVPRTEDGTVTVTKEDCTLTSPATVLSSASGPTLLTASLGEPDSSLGDRSGKSIVFSGFDSKSVPIGPFAATTDTTGNASATAALSQDVYSINASFNGDAFYNPCQTTADTIVTVSPAAFKVTGGGWVANGVGQTSFGFNALSDVTGLHGQIQIRTSNKGNFHGDAVANLAGTATTAQWSGSGSWNGAPGYTFVASVLDAGTSGKKGDTISLTIASPTGTTIYTTNGFVPLKGGNIVVH